MVGSRYIRWYTGKVVDISGSKLVDILGGRVVDILGSNVTAQAGRWP